MRAGHGHEPLVAEYAEVYSFIDVARSVIEPAALAAVQPFDLRDVAVGEPSYLHDTFRLLVLLLRRGEGLRRDHHPQHGLVTAQQEEAVHCLHVILSKRREGLGRPRMQAEQGGQGVRVAEGH